MTNIPNKAYLPSYLKEQLHYDLEESGFISSLPNLIKVILTLLAGFVADFLIKSTSAANPFVRKLMTTLGLFIPGKGVIVLSCVMIHKLYYTLIKH